MHNAIEHFHRLAHLPEAEIDLGRAALLIAAVEYPALDVEQQLRLLDSLAAAASRRIGDNPDPLTAVNRLSEYLFDEVGFHGNQEEYYDPRNSFLNDVLARRTGIPIALSLVCIEVGRRLDIPLLAIGMPGHLLLRHRDVEDWYIDPFFGGILLSPGETEQRLQDIAQGTVPWDPQYLTPLGNREFIARMLRNLKAIYLNQRDYTRALPLLDRLVIIQPEAKQEIRDRGVVHYRLRHLQEALDDLQSYLAATAPAEDTASVERLMEQVRRAMGTGSRS